MPVIYAEVITIALVTLNEHSSGTCVIRVACPTVIRGNQSVFNVGVEGVLIVISLSVGWEELTFADRWLGPMRCSGKL